MSDAPKPPGRPVSLLRRRLLLAAGLVASAAFFGWARQAQAPNPAAKPAPRLGARLDVNVYADGRPAEGARVQLFADRELRRSGVSDAHGDVHLVDCPVGRFIVVAEAPGFARATSTVELGAQPARQQFDLLPGGVVRGTLLDESERPLPGIEVLARVLGHGSPGLPWIVSADEDGRFVIDTMPLRARITLDIVGDAEHDSSAVADLQLPAEPLTIVLRRTASLTGRAVQSDGAAASAALVTLAGSGVWPPRTASADAAGEFRFDRVPEGIYELRGELADAVSAPLEGIVIGPGNRARVELVLSPGLVLRGHVRDAASGRPLAAAEVEATEESLSATPKRARSDADGSFQIGALRALPHRVRVSAEAYVVLERWHVPSEGAFEAELLRAVSVSGSVEDSSGRPVPFASLEVAGHSETGAAIRMVGPINDSEPSPSATAAGDTLTVTSGPVPRIPLVGNAGDPAFAASAGFHSDAEGKFRLEGLPPGELVVSAFKLGHAPGHSRTLRLRPGSSVNDVQIVLPSGVTLRGQVVDRYRAPSPHVRVELTLQDGPARSTVSADDGGFEFEGVRGDCTLTARPPSGPSVRVEVPAAELGHDVRLVLEQATDRLRGRVLDVRGRPIEAASIHLQTASKSFNASAVSSADGSFELERLPAPPYSVRVEHPEYAPRAELSVRATDTPLLVQLEAGATLGGSVIAAHSKEALGSVRISVSAGQLERTARSARDGTFEFRHLPLGAYTLQVEAEGYLRETRNGSLQPMAADAAQLEKIALTRSGGASGDIVDRLGAVVWNAEVAAGDPPDWAHAARSNHAGRFQLAPLAAGEHRLTARSGTLSVVTREPVRVYEAQITPGVVLRRPGIPEPSEEAPDKPVPNKTAPAANAGGAPLVFGSRGAYVVVERVAPGSAAAESGLQVGDVLVSANGEPVRSAAQARGMLARIPGQEIAWTLEVRRAGALQRLRYYAR